MVYLAHRTQLSAGEESTAGTVASTSVTQFGMVASVDFPDPVKEWKQYWSFGSRDYNVKAEGKNTFEGSFDCVLQNPTMLFYGFGKETCTATVSGTGQTTTTAVMSIGDTTATLTSAAGYTANLYVQIGASGEKEIRKVSSKSGSVIILDQGVRFAHASGVTASLQTGVVYTHTLAVDNTLKSFTLEAAQLDDTNFVRKFTGTYIDTMDIGCEEEGELMVSYGMKALGIEASGTSASAVSILSTVPYMFDEGAITIFGGAIARITDFKVSINNKLKPKWYIQSTSARYPYELNTGHREISITVNAVPNAKTWWDKLKTTPTATTFTAVFTRGASDTITITATDVNIEEAPHPFNEENEQTVQMTFVAKTCTITGVDALPYYKAV